MKPSEILRSLADMIDAKQALRSQPGALPSGIQPAPSEEVPELGDGDGSGLAQQPDDLFIPPLQLKLELLKKANGVDNIFDNEEESNSDQGIDRLKKLAGIFAANTDSDVK